MDLIKKENYFFYGFDYLRTVMIISIVLWHTGFFGRQDVLNISQYCLRSITLSDIICLNFFMLGVPVFFVISLFLFLSKLRVKKRYFLNRMERLIYLYIFWTGLWLLILHGKGFGVFPAIFKQNPEKLFYYIAFAGESVFWFLFSLIFLTFITYLCVKIPKFLLWFLLIFSTLFLWIGPIIGITHSPKVFYWMQCWVPLIHLPYAFIAIIASRYIKPQIIKKASYHYIVIGVLFTIFIATSVCEWKWILHRCHYSNYGNITEYARISVVAGTSLLIYLSFLIKHPPNKLIKFISDHSLGIFCLHPFVQAAWSQLVEYIPPLTLNST